MTPSARHRRKKQAIQERQRAPSPDLPWAAAFFKTVPGEPRAEEVPARHWLLTEIPRPARIFLVAVIDSVVLAPPPAFPASHLWHAMTDDMAGIHEARDAHEDCLYRCLYRLFCVVDRKATRNGIDRPLVTLLGGGIKPVRAAMSRAVYQLVREYRDAYLASNPRQILLPPKMPAEFTGKQK